MKKPTSLAIDEMREFATFKPSEQRYIKRSLDIALKRDNAFFRWARNGQEIASIQQQYVAYQQLDDLRRMIPDNDKSQGSEAFRGKLSGLSAFDLAQGSLKSFDAYRYLYERLLGGKVRPWLVGAFCWGASSLQIAPDMRKQLLQSIREVTATAPVWLTTEPATHPPGVAKESLDIPPGFVPRNPPMGGARFLPPPRPR